MLWRWHVQQTVWWRWFPVIIREVPKQHPLTLAPSLTLHLQTGDTDGPQSCLTFSSVLTCNHSVTFTFRYLFNKSSHPSSTVSHLEIHLVMQVNRFSCINMMLSNQCDFFLSRSCHRRKLLPRVQVCSNPRGQPRSLSIAFYWLHSFKLGTVCLKMAVIN